MNPKNYITQSGYITLQEELNNLVMKERPKLVEIINWAAGNGDRSENGDYIYGKRRLREVDKSIHHLIRRLEIAEVVNSDAHIGSDQVFFGATVTILRNLKHKQIVKIVGQDEINPHLNHISWTSPLAKVLLNKNIGDAFKFSIFASEELIEILDVNYIS